jgi:hypothetical protein
MQEKVQTEMLEKILKLQDEVKRLTEHVIKLRSDLSEIILLNVVDRASAQESQENKKTQR